jgi:hypothetical protein
MKSVAYRRIDLDAHPKRKWVRHPRGARIGQALDAFGNRTVATLVLRSTLALDRGSEG